MRITGMVALALVGVLTGCSSSADDQADPTNSSTSSADPSTEASTEPSTEASSGPSAEPMVYTVQQLAAALPKKRQVPEALSVEPSCPGSEFCASMRGEKGERSVRLELRSRADPAELEAQAASDAPYVPPFGDVGGHRFRTAKVAAAAVAELDQTNAKYEGRFDEPGERTGEDTYTAGVRGRGAFAPTTIGDFAGTLYTRSYVLSSPEDVQGGRYLEATVRVSSGTTYVDAVVVLEAKDRDPQAAATLVQQLATDYVERLQAG